MVVLGGAGVTVLASQHYLPCMSSILCHDRLEDLGSNPRHPFLLVEYVKKKVQS